MRRHGLFLAVICGVLAAWGPVRLLAPAESAQAAFNVSMVLLGAAMALAAWARSKASPLSDVWRPYAVAGMAWAFSYTVVGLYQTIQGHLAPLPSLADIGYLLFVAAIANTLARLHPGAHEWRDLLDGAIVAASLALLASLTGIGQLFARGEVPRPAGIILASYVLAQIVLVSMAIMATLKVPSSARLPLVMVAAALACIAVSEGGLLVLRLEGAAGRGVLEESFRLIGVALLAAVPLLPHPLHRAMVQEPGLPTVLLPVVLALAGVALVVRDSLLRTSWTPLQGALGAALLGLMLIRMTATGFVDLRLRRERAVAIEQLRDVEAQRKLMLRAISHEIQNPLTPVMLHAQLVAKQAPSLSGSLEVIQRNIKQVSRLAQDLNMIAKSDAESFDLAIEPMDLFTLAQHVVDAERPNADRRGVEMAWLPSVPAPIMADPDRMTQVVGNLVRNALKFTPAGGHVTVQVTTGESARVTVTDTGRGLAPDEASRLFDAFTQVHDRAAQPIEDRGSGLGLYISKRLVLSHGGRMGVRSQGRGQGSTFWFEVPLATGGLA